MTYKIGNILSDAVQGKIQYATQEVQHQRLETCKTCEHYRSAMRVCGSCGCYLPAKVKFEKSSCPVGKW